MNCKRRCPNAKSSLERRAIPAATPADRDRAAAEWVLAQGGRVGYVDASGGGFANAVAELPTHEFQVNDILLRDKRQVVSADLERFVGLPKLEGLHLTNTSVDTEAIPRIAKMPPLLSLVLGGTRVKCSDLPGLAGLPRLAYLALDAQTEVDDDWAGIERLRSLHRLGLTRVSANDLRRLGELKQLRTIWLLDGQDADEQAVEDLQHANPLCRVLVGNKPVKVVGRDPVGELAKRLLAKGAELELQGFPDSSVAGIPTDAEINAGKPLTITKIALPPHTALDDEELRWLTCPWPIFEFNAEFALGADRFAASLARQTKLGYITLANSDLTDDGLAHFKRLPSLKYLDVQRTKVSRRRDLAARDAS